VATVPFKRHPAQPVLDVMLWIAFVLTAVLALLVVLGLVGTGWPIWN
jgi:hypothetical protein